MPISRLLQNSAFEPSEIDALIEAFETICLELALGKSQAALREKIAQKVIELGELGERNPDTISQCVIKDMRGRARSLVRPMGRVAASELASQNQRQAQPQAKFQS